MRTQAHLHHICISMYTQYSYICISLGIVASCTNFVRFRGSQPLLPHLCPLSVLFGGGGVLEVEEGGGGGLKGGGGEVWLGPPSS